jgi:hypothetical protein
MACDEAIIYNRIGPRKVRCKKDAMAITSGTGAALTILRMATLYGEEIQAKLLDLSI